MTKKLAVLFQGEGEKDLRITYPELSNTEEFRSLTKEEMFFVYNYACASSPVIKMLPDRRVLRCLPLIKDKLSTKQLQEYAKLQFPDKIQFAIDRMDKFDLVARMRGKAINEKIFTKLEEYVDTELGETATIEEKKSHVAMLSSISKILPSIIFQVESGFGVKYVAPVEEIEDNSKVSWESIISSKA
jgi:hypothetical protein